MAGENAPALRETEEDDAPLRLKDLEFTDLYISERGDAFMRGLIDIEDPLYPIEDGLIDDLHKVKLKVTERGQAENEFTIDHDEVRYRVSKIRDEREPTYVLRRAMYPIPALKSFNLNPLVVQALGQVGNNKARGLILFSGPTGHGKTTTAGALLQAYLRNYGGVAICIEDPPELFLSGRHGKFGVCYQIRVENGDFATPLRQAMRQAPRYIFLGEIRDAESAAEALQACNSGHVVIATTHAGSISEAINRMMKLVSSKLDPDLARSLLADGLSVVINQRLERAKDREGKIRRVLTAQTLFFGEDAGLRAKVRDDKIVQIASDIEQQAMKIANQKSPLMTGGTQRSER